MMIVITEDGVNMGTTIRPWPQVPAEVVRFAVLLREKGVKRYLEIGSRHGDTFDLVMQALGPDATGVAVDWPAADGYDEQSLPNLEANVAKHNASLIVGDSRSLDVIEMVTAKGPYDAILIDGDHSYDGAMADWRSYGPLAPIVAFHDIVNVSQDVAVPRVWEELSAGREVEEIVAPGSIMGFGVILDNEVRP